MTEDDSLWRQTKELANIKKDSSECESLLTESMNHYPKEQSNGSSLFQSSCDHDNQVHKIHRAVKRVTTNSVDSNMLSKFLILKGLIHYDTPNDKNNPTMRIVTRIYLDFSILLPLLLQTLQMIIYDAPFNPLKNKC